MSHNKQSKLLPTLGILACLFVTCCCRSLEDCVSTFWCSNNKCLPYISYVCDRYDDCGDNSDERSCQGCEKGSFSCQNGDSTNPQCIDPVLVCDKSCDCETCKDETECYYNLRLTTTTTTPGSNRPSCENGSFSCQNGDSTNPQCIDPVLVCDKSCDCETCKDETECYYNLPTTGPQKPNCVSTFSCSNNKCLYWTSRVCDGDNNCGDNSDERSCQGCEKGSFSCQNGDSNNPQCIDPVLVCDKSCDCETCKDETECYYNLRLTTTITTPGSNRPSGTTMVVSIVVFVCVVFLLVMITVCAQKYRSQKRTPSLDSTNTNLAYVTTEQQLQEQYQPEMDFPPEYETVNDGPVFSVSPSLFSYDSNDGLPTYNEVNVPLSDHQLHGEVNASMANEEEIEPPPPSYDTVADVFNTNIASTESSSTDGESVRFGRSSSCYSNTASHDL